MSVNSIHSLYHNITCQTTILESTEVLMMYRCTNVSLSISVFNVSSILYPVSCILMYWCTDVCTAVYITVSLYIDDVLMSVNSITNCESVLSSIYYTSKFHKKSSKIVLKSRSRGGLGRSCGLFLLQIGLSWASWGALCTQC